MRIDGQSAYQSYGFLTQSPTVVHTRTPDFEAAESTTPLKSHSSEHSKADQDYAQAQLHSRIYGHASAVSSDVVGLLEGTPDL